MSTAIFEQRIYCPYCGEPMHILLDTSAGEQSYIEDCQICCRPMQVSFTCSENGVDDVRVTRDS